MAWHDWVWITILVTYPLQWVGALIEVLWTRGRAVNESPVRESRGESMSMKKKNRHIVAKVFLAIGLLDALFTLGVWAYTGSFSPTFFIRAVLWIGLPLLFILRR